MIEILPRAILLTMPYAAFHLAGSIAGNFQNGNSHHLASNINI